MKIACTLTGQDQKSQRERWLALRAKHGLARHEAADGLQLTFEDQPGVEAELRALLAVENGCCAWATWTVEREGDGVIAIAARSEGHGIATLHAMFKM